MKRFCEIYKITKYQKYICINDVIENVLSATNKNYYINKIDETKLKIFNNKKYITKNTLINFLGCCKNKEAKIALDLIKTNQEMECLQMDTNTGVITYNNNNITVNTHNNELWIKAKDITTLLGYTNTKDVLSKYVDEDDMCKQYNLDNTQQRKNSPIYINESGFYALVLNSEHQQAKQIKKWITKIVLPTIRKTGLYNHSNEIRKLQEYNKLLKKNNKKLQNELLNKKKIKKTKETIPKAVRIKVWSEYIGDSIAEGKCFCCRNKTIYQHDFQCGHIQSEHNGGKVTVQNLRPICCTCNQSMGTKNMFRFMEQYGFDTGHI